jgi:hypothetical protein
MSATVSATPLPIVPLPITSTVLIIDLYRSLTSHERHVVFLVFA